jgi:hypothetical protein
MNKASKINLQNKTVLALAISLSFIAPTQAADFTIVSGQVETNPQTLTNDNDIGVIELGGELNTPFTAITGSANNNSVTNQGIISTQGGWLDAGIILTGDNATISNQGSITTPYHAIRVIGNNATISNQGDMSVTSHAIDVTGNDATISNQGSITAAGAYAITTGNSDNATIINQGSITGTAYTIDANGSNATISNQGSISGTAYTISATGSNATISNQGSIITGSYGISATGSNATISNQGSISGTSYTISATGSNTTISNQGSIITGSYGINATGSNATVSNQGSIISDGIGIALTGMNSTLSNQGSIVGGSYGILAANSSVNNQGSVSAEGVNSTGIYSYGSTFTLNNQGSISAEGTNSKGINSSSADATINNSGSISASGPGSFAIYSPSFATSDTTLNLLPGSQIIGRIDLGNNDGPNKDTANVYGGSVSANLTFENTENINLFGTGVVSDNNVVTVDTTGESTRGVALSSMTSSIHSVIGQRMAQTTPLKPVQVAALTLSPGMYFEEHKPAAWAQAFGGTFDRDAEGSALAYDYDHVGMNFGYEWDVNQTRVGLMGGVVLSETQTQTASFSSDANNYYVGAYGNRKMNGFHITGSLLAGYGDHENDRLVIDNLNGFEVAKSDFDSFFISPSLTIASAYTVDDRLELRPSASMSYSMAWLDGYSEQGTTNSNLTIDDRKAKALTAKVQVAAAYALTTSSEFEFRVGMNARHTNDDDTKVGIAGSQFKFANAGDESVTGGFAGASIRVVDENNLTLVADMEFGGNSDEDYAAGSVSLEYVF